MAWAHGITAFLCFLGVGLLVIVLFDPRNKEANSLLVVVVTAGLIVSVYAFIFTYKLVLNPPKIGRSRTRPRHWLFRWASAYRRFQRKRWTAAFEKLRQEREAAERNEHKVETVNTEAAVEDMRLARSYLDDWMNAKGGIKEAKKSDLSFAAKYVAVARTKDPNAKLIIEDKQSKEPQSYTQDDLAAETLFYESQYHSGENADEQNLKKARDILRQALTYKPESIQYREHLADVFINLHDKNSALHVAYQALRIAPYDLRARKLLDRVDAAEQTYPAPNTELTGGLTTAAGSIGMFGGFVFTIAGMFAGYATLGVLIFIAGAVTYFIGTQMTAAFIFQKVMENQLRKQGGK